MKAKTIPTALGYRAREDGVIESCRRQGAGAMDPTQWHVIASAPDSDGYATVTIYGDRRKTRRVHHLVLEAFVGLRPEGMEGCHNDGDHTNNAATNLRWGTPTSNQRDRVQHGTHSRKLTSADVTTIGTMLTDGVRQSTIARWFGVGRSVVDRVRAGKYPT